MVVVMIVTGPSLTSNAMAVIGPAQVATRWFLIVRLNVLFARVRLNAGAAEPARTELARDSLVSLAGGLQEIVLSSGRRLLKHRRRLLRHLPLRLRRGLVGHLVLLGNVGVLVPGLGLLLERSKLVSRGSAL